MVLINLVCHSNGEFTVGRFTHGSDRFTMRKAADARAKELQERAGGPNKAEIRVLDLTRN
jgi:hypothetical protein